MNKNAIKKFAIEARKKLIDSVTDKAGMLGITEKSCSEPITKGVDFEVYQTVAGTEVTLNKRQCEQRRRLVSQIHSRGFEAVVEEVAYTWFNRICAIRFMEVNDYLPNRVRVLSSEKEGKMEPDLVTQAPDVDLDLTAQEKEEIINWKLSGTSEDTDKLYCKLFLKQCHQLHDILPGLFEADSDYMELLFGISYTNKDDVIYMLVNPDTGIPEEDFDVSAVDEEGNPIGQVEIIGWLYQYYNTELKDDTFAKLKKNIKITKERIPAATQLFTPDWIVRYMVENSVGRIWIEHLRAVDPTTDEKATAERFGWKYYLPEAEQEESVNVKLAEIRSTYKDLKPTDITCIDPCMGSGHILIAMFDVLMDIYESAGYDKREAAFEIVEYNIHGLDIDQRAYQLAYFAVMMKGRGYNRRFLRGRDGKLEPKVYAITESNEINRNHLKFFGTHLSDMERNLVVMQMEELLDTFIDAREYGSILNVDACDWDALERFVEDLGTDGQISFESVGSEETQEQLRKLVHVAKNLGEKYDVVVTNPPYMGASGMEVKLSKYVKDNYPDSKSDLFAVFIEKCSQMAKRNAYQAMITQHAWMFINSYESLRDKFYKKQLVSLIHLGIKAFEEIGNDVVQTCAFIVQENHTDNYQSNFIRLVDCKNYYEKEREFLAGNYQFKSNVSEFLKIPGIPMAYWVGINFIKNFEAAKYIENYGDFTGSQNITGDNEKYLRCFWEVKSDSIGNRWRFYAKGGDYRQYYGNLSFVVDWSESARLFYATNKTSNLLNEDFWYKEGVTYSAITSRGTGFRFLPAGCIFDKGGPTINLKSNIQEILALLNTNVAKYYFWVFNPSINLQVKDVKSFPIKLSHNEEVISKAKVNIRLCKEDWDAFELSRDFMEHPLVRWSKESEENIKGFMFHYYKKRPVVSCPLELSSLLWMGECNERFEQLKKNEEELNHIFINIYGLQSEISSDVEERDVTVRKADLKRDIRSLISYAVGCMFGRYSLDEKGIIYAGGKWDDNKYKSFIPDEDNCIPITDEEYFMDDICGRFCEFLKVIYGEDSLEDNLNFIALVLGNKGNTSREVIRNYFLEDFYKDHCSDYSVTGSGKRPIYWLFDSGKQNGFKALIYMHRYDADTVGRVRTDYLHRAQKYVETAMQSAQYTIENATSASEKSKATKAVNKYTKQLAEMKIYDEAIAHIANKRIEIDLDDGVKVNYAKFQGVEVAQEGKKELKVDLLAKIK